MTSSPLCKYTGHSFIVAPGLAESRGGLVAASLAVVSAAGESRRCGAGGAEAFATSSEEWEDRSTGSQSMPTRHVENAATKAMVRRPLVLLHGAELKGKERRGERRVIRVYYFAWLDRYTP